MGKGSLVKKAPCAVCTCVFWWGGWVQRLQWDHGSKETVHLWCQWLETVWGGVCECVVTIKDQARQVASGWSGLGASACGYVSVSVTTEGIGYQRDDGILTSCWRDCRVWGTMCPSLHTYLCFCAGSKREEQGSRISNWTDCVSKASYWRDSQCMCV